MFDPRHPLAVLASRSPWPGIDAAVPIELVGSNEHLMSLPCKTAATRMNAGFSARILRAVSLDFDTPGF
jgi:hypothetical protein